MLERRVESKERLGLAALGDQVRDLLGFQPLVDLPVGLAHPLAVAVHLAEGGQ